jgi:hypothetical protein
VLGCWLVGQALSARGEFQRSIRAITQLIATEYARIAQAQTQRMPNAAETDLVTQASACTHTHAPYCVVLCCAVLC